LQSDPPNLANIAMQKLVEENDIEDVDPVLEDIINKDCHFGNPEAGIMNFGSKVFMYSFVACNWVVLLVGLCFPAPSKSNLASGAAY
jgi:hypothetical protein